MSFLGIIFVLVVTGLVAKAFSPSRKSPTKPEHNSVPSDVKFSFVAMQYYNLMMNRTCKVYVTDNFLYGAVVGGLISAQMGSIGDEWQNPEFYVDDLWERQQLDRGLGSEEFLKVRGNFKIQRSDISTVEFKKRKWGMANIPYSGKLIIREKKGKKTELILLGKQEPEIVKHQILKS